MGRRKQNGEGTVFRVSENKWVAKICMGTRPDGKPNIKQFSGKTEAIVKKKLKEFKKSNDYAEKHMPSSYTVISYFNDWLKENQYNKLKPLSYDRLESTVVNHIFPNLGGYKVDKITREQIQSLINKLKKQGLSYSSIKKVYMALNSCYNYALINDDVIKNPCMCVVLPKAAENTKQIVAFSEDEVERIKKEFARKTPIGDNYYHYSNAYNLILNTGLRMGEALSLTWDDVDFKRRILKVNKNNVMTKKRDEDGNKIGGYELKTQDILKTINGRRGIPLNNSAITSLTEMKLNNSTSYVVINRKGNKPLPGNFERGFYALLKNLNFKKCGVHTLRHTFASMLFAKGVDVKIVSQLLGHSSVKITYDTYVHLFQKDIQHITNILD